MAEKSLKMQHGLFSRINFSIEQSLPKNEVNFYLLRPNLHSRPKERQRVNESSFDKIIEDNCSRSIPMFERTGGIELKKLFDAGVVGSISVWQIDRCRRGLRGIINFF
ncbi:MAG: hypothetical protein O3A40_10600 [Bacteroidetes bacterium]|nr:hypothetical protein [Bacteroidota bacterium]